jgi:hypothetical protein
MTRPGDPHRAAREGLPMARPARADPADPAARA